MLSRRRAAGASGGAAPSSVHSIVEQRLAAFAPLHLPALVAGLDSDEVAAMVPEDLAVMERLTGHRVRMTHVLLMVCLHIGSDPPDYPRIEPCARLECWIDPHVPPMMRCAVDGGSESITDALEQQYRLQQRDAVVKRAVEVHIEDAKHAMQLLRRKARDGRVLLHYNGHGMPRATVHGEIWLFDKNRTHYVPINIYEMTQLLDSPTLYVLDCNSAGSILQYWYKERLHERWPQNMLICACGVDEFLPLNPQLPADVLTSCLTTPLRMALEWYVSYSHRKHLLPHVTAEMIRNIPGDLNDRKSPLGELQWILFAVTETIAWCTFTPTHFHQLFRQDSMTKSLFRNFLLADRLMREVGCIPVTHPRVAEEAHLHHMWELWDYTLENAICQLPELLTPELTVNVNYTYHHSSFFTDQLMAFEVWVESGDLMDQPEELPSVLSALTQKSYRVLALSLLVKYLDSGVIAGKRAILCGILPYASKLFIQSPPVFLIVSVLWMQVVRSDPAQGTAELIKSSSDKHFIRLLHLDEENTPVIIVDDGRTVTSDCNNSPISFGHAGINAGDSSCPDSHDQRPFSSGEDSMPSSSNKWIQPTQPVPGEVSSGMATDAESHYYLMREVDLHRCKAMACYVLWQLLKRGGERQCVLCWNNQLLNAAFSRLASPNAEVRSWSCLVLAQLFLGLRHAKNFASQECTTRLDLFTQLLQDRSPIVRSSCVTLLASLVGLRVDELPLDQQVRRVQMEKSLLIKLRSFVYDASMSVREELIFFACQVLYYYGSLVPSLRNLSSVGRYMEYLQEVGGGSSHWILDEPDVQVKSQLNVSRPTVNSRFDHSVVFTIGFIARDDPAPSSAILNETSIDTKVIGVLQEMVHDAALMLFLLYQTCDTSKVTAAINALANNSTPQSHRFANEALRTMSRVVSTDSSYFISEADRARSTKNTDSMLQLVLEMQDRRLDPPYSANKSRTGRGESFGSGAPDSNSNSTNKSNNTNNTNNSNINNKSYTHTSTTTTTANSNSNSVNEDTPNSPLTAPAMRHQVLPSLISGEQVIATAFRALEPAMVFATSKQRIFHVSYDTYSSQTLIHNFTVRLAASLHDVIIVNDLSEQAGLLLINKHGGFCLVRSCWEESQGVPTEVATFSACPPKGTVDVKCVYRPYNANLLYGGPIGVGGRAEVHVLSMDEEQVIQRLEVSGDPTITSLTAHTTGRALFAGCSDGVVRYYDDRQKQGYLGAVGLLSRRGVASASVEPIVAAGPVESSAALMIATATRSAVRIYDSRKTSEPTLEVESSALYSGHPTRSSPFALGSSIVGKPPSITAFSTGVHTGLLSMLFSDNSYAAVNMRGQLLLERPLKVTNTQGPILPPSCLTHSLRPLVSAGGELLFLQ